MPFEYLSVGLEIWVFGHSDFMPVQVIIIFAVVEFLMDSLANFKMVIRCDRYVPAVKKRMKISPQ